MTTWKQERPAWCGHKDCKFVQRVQDAMCGGHLPVPEPHNGDFNDHRLCLRFKDDGSVTDIQCNNTDLYALFRIISKLRGVRWK